MPWPFAFRQTLALIAVMMTAIITIITAGIASYTTSQNTLLQAKQSLIVANQEKTHTSLDIIMRQKEQAVFVLQSKLDQANKIIANINWECIKTSPYHPMDPGIGTPQRATRKD